VLSFADRFAPAGRLPLIVVVKSTHVGVEAVESGASAFVEMGQLDRPYFGEVMERAIVAFRNRRDLGTMQAELVRLSSADPLTGLMNRRGFESVLLNEVARARRRGETLAALLIDCDDFKSINAAHGHAGGDEVLKHVATTLERTLRVTDHVARVGGDEFLILLPDTTLPQALSLAERIRATVAGPVRTIADARVTVSIGVARVPLAILSSTQVMAAAQRALRISKEEGKDRVSIEEFDGAGTSRAECLHRLLQEPGLLGVASQDIIDVATGEVVAVELLIRPPPPLHQPDELFRFAADQHLLVNLDVACLERCLQAANGIQPGLAIHVNLFPVTLHNAPTEQLVKAFGKHDQLRPLRVELNEQQAVGEVEGMLTTIEALRQAGVSVAVDDMGFGRTCLETLLLTQPEFVKIDRRWVSGVGASPWRRRVLERILSVGRSLGASMVAEGVESESDLDTLRSLGVAFAQGYHVGRPRMIVAPVVDELDLDMPTLVRLPTAENEGGPEEEG
jgi:diguanylate cyclase (GGDEF)-like protein